MGQPEAGARSHTYHHIEMGESIFFDAKICENCVLTIITLLYSSNACDILPTQKLWGELAIYEPLPTTYIGGSIYTRLP